MESKTKKRLKIALNVIVYVLFALIFLLMILIVTSGGKGYTNIFGTAFVAVETDSMNGDRDDSFKPGALLKVKILSDEEKYELQVGDIISFYDIIDGRRAINSHRIIEVWGEGYNRVYTTQGDNVGLPDANSRTPDEIIGKVKGHTNGIGKIFLFIRTPAGFGVCVILPCLLLLGYCIFDLVKAVIEQKKQTKAESKELLKEQLLEELRAEGKLPPVDKTEETERKE